MEITDAIQAFIRAREVLETYGIRDTGDYAEVLVAKALTAARNRNGVTKGFDLWCPVRGRIEVRSRTLPRDGRNEDRLELPKKKIGHFDVFAGILFAPDQAVVGGFLLAHDLAVELSRRQDFLRIPFRLGKEHGEDISDLLRRAQVLL